MFLFSKSATKRISLSVHLLISFLCLTQERKAAESSNLVDILMTSAMVRSVCQRSSSQRSDMKAIVWKTEKAWMACSAV